MIFFRNAQNPLFHDPKPSEIRECWAGVDKGRAKEIQSGIVREKSVRGSLQEPAVSHVKIRLYFQNLSRDKVVNHISE
jgi:hypothetical protein